MTCLADTLTSRYPCTVSWCAFVVGLVAFSIGHPQ